MVFQCRIRISVAGLEKTVRPYSYCQNNFKLLCIPVFICYFHVNSSYYSPLLQKCPLTCTGSFELLSYSLCSPLPGSLKPPADYQMHELLLDGHMNCFVATAGATITHSGVGFYAKGDLHSKIKATREMMDLFCLYLKTNELNITSYRWMFRCSSFTSINSMLSCNYYNFST